MVVKCKLIIPEQGHCAVCDEWYRKYTGKRTTSRTTTGDARGSGVTASSRGARGSAADVRRGSR